MSRTPVPLTLRFTEEPLKMEPSRVVIPGPRYVMEVLNDLRCPWKGRLLDAGAGCGSFSIPAAVLGRFTIMAVEPDPEHLAVLIWNVRRNADILEGKVLPLGCRLEDFHTPVDEVLTDPPWGRRSGVDKAPNLNVLLGFLDECMDLVGRRKGRLVTRCPPEFIEEVVGWAAERGFLVDRIKRRHKAAVVVLRHEDNPDYHPSLEDALDAAQGEPIVLGEPVPPPPGEEGAPERVSVITEYRSGYHVWNIPWTDRVAAFVRGLRPPGSA